MLQRYIITARAKDGRSLGLASASVYVDALDNTLASLYDEDGVALSNPVVLGSRGTTEVYIDDAETVTPYGLLASDTVRFALRRLIAEPAHITGLQTALRLRPPISMSQVREVPGYPVALFEADESWSAGSAITTEPYVGIGKQSRLLTSTNAVNANSDLALSTPWVWDYVNYPQMELVFYVDNVANLSSIALLPSTSSAFAKYFAWGSTDRDTTIRTGWNVLRMRKEWFTAVGGAVDADWANINTLRIRAKALANVTVNVYFAAWRAVRPPAIVLLDHDDGGTTVEDAWAIEEEYGLRSTNYVLPARVGTTYYSTWDSLWAAYVNGHDVASHTWDHERLSTLAEADVRTSVRKAWRELVGRGFTRSARFFATPWGETSATIRSVVGEFHTTLRHGGSAGVWAPYPGYNPLNGMHAFNNISDDVPDLVTVLGWIDGLADTGGLLHLLVHGIGAGADRATAAYYRALCAKLVSTENVVCMTMSELYDQGVATVGPDPMRFGISPLTGTPALSRKV